MDHEKVVLADAIDWQFLSDKMDDVYADGLGQPPLSTRLMAGLQIPKYTDDRDSPRKSDRLSSVIR